MRLPHRPTLFPYTTLFRSCSRLVAGRLLEAAGPGLHLPLPPGYFLAAHVDPRGVFPHALLADRELPLPGLELAGPRFDGRDRKSTRLNSSHTVISYAVFCLNHAATTSSYTLPLHDALPILLASGRGPPARGRGPGPSPPAPARLLPRRARRPARRLPARAARRPRAPAPGPRARGPALRRSRSEEHTSELQSHSDLVCRLLLESCGYHIVLHSSPTRRSSDLARVWSRAACSRPRARAFTSRSRPATSSPRTSTRAASSRTRCSPTASSRSRASSSRARASTVEIGRAHV